MTKLWKNCLKFIVISSLIAMPLFMSSCRGGIEPDMIEGVEEAGVEEAGVEEAGEEEAGEEEIEEEEVILPVASLKLVRLDGTEMALSAAPIPKAVRIKITFDRALDESEQVAVQSSFVLKEGDSSLAVSFEWPDDQTVIITPAQWFSYGATYAVGLGSEVATFAAQVTKATEFSELEFTIATWGDTNGDGGSDIIVGAPGKAGIGGGAYIVAAAGDCDISADCQPEATIVGTADHFQLGYSVSMVGDVNADGYIDVMVSSLGWVPFRGWAYIFHGSESEIGDCDLSDPNTCTPDTTIAGATVDDRFGRCVSDAGDVNGDGYDDIVVTAHRAVDARGQVYVFLGQESGVGDCDLSVLPPDPDDCNPHATITGSNAGDELGVSVSGAGDVNGDGYDDIIVSGGAFLVYVFHGSGGGLDTNPDATITIGDIVTRVSDAGDVNGDGYDDIIVGVDRAGDNDQGQAFVFLGSESGITKAIPECDLSVDCVADSTITGAEIDDLLGYFVSGAGDVNGDGKDDIVVAASTVINARGNVYVLHGSESGISNCDLSADPPNDCTPDATITGEVVDDFRHASVFGAGDVNGDDYDDIVVTAYEAADWKGQAYVFHGSGNGISDCNLSPPDSCEPDITITGDVDDKLGHAY